MKCFIIMVKRVRQRKKFCVEVEVVECNKNFFLCLGLWEEWQGCERYYDKFNWWYKLCWCYCFYIYFFIYEKQVGYQEGEDYDENVFKNLEWEGYFFVVDYCEVYCYYCYCYWYCFVEVVCYGVVEVFFCFRGIFDLFQQLGYQENEEDCGV